VRLWKTYLQNRLLFKYSIPIVNSKFNQLICFSMRVLLTCCIWLCLIWQSLTLNNSVLDEGRSPCNEVISPVTLTLSMICINLLLTLIKEIKVTPKYHTSYQSEITSQTSTHICLITFIFHKSRKKQWCIIYHIRAYLNHFSFIFVWRSPYLVVDVTHMQDIQSEQPSLHTLDIVEKIKLLYF